MIRMRRTDRKDIFIERERDLFGGGRLEVIYIKKILMKFLIITKGNEALRHPLKSIVPPITIFH